MVSRDMMSIEFDTPAAMKKYLKEHPDADKSKHHVKKQKSLSESHPFEPKDPKNPTDKEIDKHNRELFLLNHKKTDKSQLPSRKSSDHGKMLGVTKKGEEEMTSRSRLTREGRSVSAATLFREIERLERSLKADEDADLESEANSTAKEDISTVSEGPGEKVKDQGDQNDKSEDNWPTGVSQEMTAEERGRIAGRIVRLARALINNA